MRAQGALGEGQFARPFLHLDKHQLVDYLISKHVGWVRIPATKTLV